MANQISQKKHFGLWELTQEVLDTDACTACGGCVSLCANIIALGDCIAPLADCSIDTGKCYHFCPRTKPFSECNELAGDLDFKGAVGSILDYHVARSIEPNKDGNSQYGGVASTLLAKALENNLINGAVVTSSSGDLPYSFTATTRKEINNAAGSKFALSPTNMEVNRFLLSNPDAVLGVVGLPCQCTGLRKKQLYPEKNENEGLVTLIIGLFCTWSLTQLGWRKLLKNYGYKNIERVDLFPPPAKVMEIISQGRSYDIPLETVKQYIRPGCHVCMDMTAENADISIGMVEGLPGYNTVILRTEQGKTLFQNAIDDGQLEILSLEEYRWQHLCEASLNKKSRAIINAQNRPASLPYYQRIINLQERISLL